MRLLDGKVAIVTGAGRGIGRAHALALAEAGAKVVVDDLGASLGGEGADHGLAEGAERLVRRALDEFGRLDILVDNAGILGDRMLAALRKRFPDGAPPAGMLELMERAGARSVRTQA